MEKVAQLLEATYFPFASGQQMKLFSVFMNKSTRNH